MGWCKDTVQRYAKTGRRESEDTTVRPLNRCPDAMIVAFILTIPDLEHGRKARELATNITFMEEGTGQYFSIADRTVYWTDIDFQDPLDNCAGSIYRIGGTV